MPLEKSGGLATTFLSFSKKGDPSYQLKRAGEYQQETFKLLSSHVRTMPEELHTTLHLTYDDLWHRGNVLAMTKNPDAARCRRYKRDTRTLKQKTVRSSEATASDELWSMKDRGPHADEKPRHKLRNAVSWSAFGLKDVFITTDSNESDNDGDCTNETAQQASTSSAPKQIGRTMHSFTFPRSDGSSSDGATRVEGHRVSHTSRSGIFADVLST
ncbi:hypothetical protein B0H21DRAFT_336025 [Amylocystis lapponica]|nr:hypothetical protein B0H21DRAFT_336025 [Amylocystis lapponica]